MGTLLIVASFILIHNTPTPSTAQQHRVTPIAMKPASTTGIQGYTMFGSDGSEYSFSALSLGSMRGHTLNQPVVGGASLPDGLGYWMVASDGGIFSFGDAQFYGSMGGHPLNKPIVGMAATPDGGGYWLVASDGGIFSFGDAQFYGSMGGHPLNQPVVGMTAVPGGGGYWMVASDGGIFSFGTAQFYGSMGGHPLNKPIVGMAAVPGGGGYWMVASDGGMFTFGDAPFLGSMGGQSIPGGVVAMSEVQTTALSSPGATGYDVSNWTCGNLPPQAPLYIVELVGAPFDASTPTSCLQSEVAWGGPATQLYLFMGDLSAPPGNLPAPSCPGTVPANECSYWQNGYLQVQFANNVATTAGVNSSIWWLDVEAAGLYWTSNTALNFATLQGAMAAVTAMGKIPGVYASPDVFPQIMGTNTIAGTPIWVADYNGYTPLQACALTPSFGGGSMVQVQYTDNGGSLDQDVAC
jgi:hypothetical protein